MSTAASFPEGQVESRSTTGECGSGSDITRVLHDRGLADKSGESTKWRRLYWCSSTHKRHKCANQIVDFIQSFLTPARFVGRSDQFETHRQQLNAILAFSGLESARTASSDNASRRHARRSRGESANDQSEVPRKAHPSRSPEVLSSRTSSG